ncbi:protein giant [Neocloeon triangulifer]|uniref:protein giant n=1 Tax=Neocloeon triangulifer TaxID=2078957 RepID=UPI00286EE853|nr:protein giant [Neocloeon triangulifer]
MDMAQSCWKTEPSHAQVASNPLFTIMGQMLPSEPLDFSSMAPSSPVLDLRVANKAHPAPSPPPSSEGSASPIPWGRDSPQEGTPLSNLLKRKAPSATRPFKAYPRYPAALPVGLLGGEVEQLLNHESQQAYESFRSDMLSKMKGEKGRRLSRSEEVHSPQHPSSSAVSPEGDLAGKDAAYWERRRKNNEAAKRSRDNRRNKEDELAIRATFLERENLILKSRLALAQAGICASCMSRKQTSPA